MLNNDNCTESDESIPAFVEAVDHLCEVEGNYGDPYVQIDVDGLVALVRARDEAVAARARHEAIEECARVCEVSAEAVALQTLLAEFCANRHWSDEDCAVLHGSVNAATGLAAVIRALKEKP